MSAITGYADARRDEIAAGVRCRVCELLIFDGPQAAADVEVPFLPHINQAHDGLCAGCAGGDDEVFFWSTAVALVEGDGGVKKTGVTTMTDLRELYPDEVVDAFEVQQREVDTGSRMKYRHADYLTPAVAEIWQGWRAEGATYQEIAERSGFPISSCTVANFLSAFDGDEDEPETAVAADPEPEAAAVAEPVRAQTGAAAETAVPPRPPTATKRPLPG